MNGGQIILADEPTGALDSKSGEEVLALLDELSRKGHTVIVITHSQEVAAHAHRVIEIRDGVIVSDAGPARAGAPRRRSARDDADRGLGLRGFVEAAKAAGRALRANLFRTALTLLGIVIGVGSVIAMLAVGDGAKQAVIDRISGMGTNLLLVRPLRREPRHGGRQHRDDDAGRRRRDRARCRTCSRRCPSSAAA